MTIPNKEQLQPFITANNLKRVNGLIIFDAEVIFYKNNEEHKINSSIQIIILPSASAVYIFEFFKEEHQQTEMFSTNDYQFNLTAANKLEVKKDNAVSGLLISVLNQ
ncbi:hypothetical protein [Ferruginibacter sp.]